MIRLQVLMSRIAVPALMLVIIVATACGAKFEEVTNDVGVHGFCCTQVAWGDYNNDGWVDIFSDNL